ncbi:MAG TPA: NADH-quinone oxidoreductase subunit K [Solirubrobacterales bacterium]|nr:NADH-quinone oxidoreductase subunit K [Solirubrobacterales bacterium]
MTLLLAATIGILFGTGAFLLMKPDLFRIVVGIVLVSNAANLTVMANGLSRGQSPILPIERGVTISDPLVQAMTITAVVIGFGVTALLLSLAYRIYVSSRTVDLDELSHAEARHEAELEREDVSV